MATPNKNVHSVNYASTKTGTRVWGVMSLDRKKVLETSESLDKLMKKWGNEYVYSIVIDHPHRMIKNIKAYALIDVDRIMDSEGTPNKTKKLIPLAISLSPRGFSKSFAKENGYTIKQVTIAID